MHSIRARITSVTVCIMVIAMVIAALLGVNALRNVGGRYADRTLLLLCQTGQKNLNQYFENVEQSVEMVSAYVESDLDGLDDEQLQAHLDRVSDIFKLLTYKNNGILTYYYRIDPSVSENVKGFWYVNMGGNSFQEHEVTDITQYDIEDTSQLVWFTVPRATGEGVWLSPYITDNLNARVISYNAPVYLNDQFVGVIGIEMDYSAMADEVNNITLYENGYAFLNDEDGVIVYHPRMDVTTMEPQPTVPDGLLSDKQFVRYRFDGVEKQAVWLPLSNGMRLNVSVPVREIQADWQNWGVEIAVSFAALLGIYIFLVMAFVGHITRPLQDLTEVAEQISQGNYDCSLDYRKKDEIGTLARTFNKVNTNLKTYIRNLNEMAFVDALTGIRNRMALRNDYDRYQGHHVAVMMLDLNNFKIINDSRGHEEGDRILRETGKLLSDTFGQAHCYRYGGDEFLVIVPDITEAEFHEKLEPMLQKAPVVDGTSTAGFSTGCVHGFLYNSDMLRSLISSADEKMYEARGDQKRTTVNGHEMTQPLVRRDGTAFGAEALARWRRSDGALVMPGDFIETLENAGRIHELDMYMWELAVKQLRAWQGTENGDLTISVNVSAKDFYSIDVFEVLSGLVDRYGVDSRMLRLEITETALLDEPEKSNAIVAKLRQRGFLVEIDDFGKGNSSLSLLKDIKADILKIDMGFLREIKDRERSRIILQSVISMAASLGMDVITEGVETRAQLDALMEMGCSHFQGFYFSRPVPAEEFRTQYAAQE